MLQSFKVANHQMFENLQHSNIEQKVEPLVKQNVGPNAEQTACQVVDNMFAKCGSKFEQLLNVKQMLDKWLTFY